MFISKISSDHLNRGTALNPRLVVSCRGVSGNSQCIVHSVSSFLAFFIRSWVDWDTGSVCNAIHALEIGHNTGHFNHGFLAKRDQ